MKFKNMAVCDLRGYNSVEAASEIESISGVALVILPKDADAQTRAAFAKVEMQNVASTIYCDTDAKINIYNGKLTLSDANVFETAVLPLTAAPDEGETLAVKGALARLVGTDREVLTLKSMGFTSDEIGELLSISGSAVRTRLQKAKQNFQNALETEGVING